MFREKIIKAIKNATEVENIKLEFPADINNGDYSTNVALANRLDVNELVEKLNSDSNLSEVVEKIEVKNNFVNFWLKERVLVDLISIDPGSEPGMTGEQKTVVYEYGQPNTHKLPHIGHLFSYIYGQSMTRILEAAGWNVVRTNYQGDIGPHVAKAIWALEKYKPVIPDLNEDKARLLQEMYQKGSEEYENDEEVKRQVDEVNKKIYLKDKSIYKIWQETRQWSLDYYKEFEEKLGIKYDRYYFESEVQEEGVDIIKNNTPNIFMKSEGAIIFEGSKHNLHDRVFVTSKGTPTYEAKDMYLQELKFEEYPKADLLVITTAHEQNEYFKVVFKALESLHPEYKDKLKHIGFGMISLKSGKMSSRTGNIISGIDLVNIVLRRVEEKYKSSKQVTEIVGLGAVKYSFLKSNPLKDMSFDINESISDEGDSGPYLQYTVVRARSVLAKAGKGRSLDFARDDIPTETEMNLLRKLSRFDEVIASAAKTYSPSTIATYIYDLAQEYNNFYSNEKIIGSEQESLRLMLTAKVGDVLEKGLNLLGIDVPNKM